ncbi:RHS repeat-associated core domain-containing protein [Actinokineospora inagensis]|uniref:RHS repeat-associated core domain-containing protein n=1 Tax=Actinokineospora inagensis TaxID=103730 RepID=UPI0012F70D8D|nr:RHS repeat-associated core domain-containing protein [Actinokineospora inagensis]
METDPNGNAATYTLDSGGRPISVKDALGHGKAQTWTANSQVQTTTDGLSNSTTASYDTTDNLISVKLPTGAQTTVGYTNTALPNLPTSVKDPAGNEVTREYDDAGNLYKVRSTALAADLDVRLRSSPTGVVTSRTDANGNQTRFDYDSAGNLITVTPPAPLGVTRYGYDSLSRITSITDGAGKKVDYAYDKLDRVVAISSGGTVLQANTYDGNGNLITRATPTVTTAFTYDTYPIGSLPTSAQRTQGTSVETVSYTYDKAGNLKTLADPAGTATYTYDAANRLTSLADAFGQTTTFTYDNADHRTGITWPGAGTQTNTYDTAGRLTALSVKNTGGTELIKATYNYKTSGGADSDLLQSKTIAGVTTDYTYDTQRHLTKAGSATFTVDKADNITNLAGAALTVNVVNQLTGNGSQTFGYNSAGDLTSVTNPTTAHEYSVTNQLVRSTTSGAQTFVASYDTVDQSQPRTIAEPGTDHVFSQTALGTSSVVRGGTRTSVSRDPDGALITEKIGTGRYNVVTDYQGSVLGLVDTAGAVAATYTYSPYGVTTATGSAANTNPFRYLGGYTLVNGQSVFGYRYYTPTLGRFTNPDPTNRERNAYAYAGSDPINNSDPTGGSFLSTVGGIVGTAAGAALVAAGCAATGGVACVVAGAVVGGLTGGTGSALGAKLNGDDDKGVADDGLDGVWGGLLGGFPWARVK